MACSRRRFRVSQNQAHRGESEHRERQRERGQPDWGGEEPEVHKQGGEEKRQASESKPWHARRQLRYAQPKGVDAIGGQEHGHPA